MYSLAQAGSNSGYPGKQLQLGQAEHRRSRYMGKIREEDWSSRQCTEYNLAGNKVVYAVGLMKE